MPDRPIESWRRTLAGAPELLELPVDHPRPPSRSFRGAFRSSFLPADVTAALRRLGEEGGATLFIVLAAAFGVLLQRLTGQDDLLIGASAGSDLLVLRADLSGELTFVGLLARLREAFLAASAQGDVPFEELVEELVPERDVSRPPLVQVLLELASGEIGTDVGLTTRFDLELRAREVHEGLEIGLVYSTDLFAATTVQRMVGSLEAVLRGAAVDAERPLPELPLLSAAERHQLLVEWSGAALGEEPRSVVERFAAQAAATPGAVALEAAGESLTYAELDRRADRLAMRLRRCGVGPEVVVGVLAERSAELVVGLLGVWKAGGAYLALDPSYPPARLAYLLEDSQAPVVVAGAGLGNLADELADELAGALPEDGVRAMRIAEILQAGHPDARDERKDLGGGKVRPPRSFRLGTRPQDDIRSGSLRHLAYLIYTSGTTGTPKAVQVEHGSLAATLAAAQEVFAFGPGDRMPCIASASFDIFFFELLGMLLAGGTCVLLPLRPNLDLERLVDEELGRATRLHAVPALMRQVVELARRRGPSGSRIHAPRLRTLFTGGDAVPADLLNDLRADFPQAAAWVLYGPTEAAIICMAWPVPAEGTGRTLLGRPLPGAEIRVCDAAGGPVPIGVSGEIRIGGAGVARGYLRREELTAEKFVTMQGRRFFRSGDVARVLSDGTLEFLGRADQQVKVRGFRIELGEVEAVLAAHPAVAEGVVLALPEPAGGHRLAAYFTTPPGEEVPRASDLRAFLGERLPRYMVPSSFVALASLPLTANRKVDRKALAKLEPAGSDSERERLAPRTPFEEELARIWEDLLGVSPIGVEDDFFDLGGHSLLATQVLSRVRRAFGVVLPPRALFAAPTVAGLARAVEGAQPDAAPLPPITPGARPARLPLSNAQLRLWFLDRSMPELRAAYNVPFAVRLRGPLGAREAEALERSLAEVIRRHEALRTVFDVDEEDHPYQVIRPAAGFDLRREDLSVPGQAPEQALRQAVDRAVEEGERPFDLTADLMLRAALWKIGEADHVLFVVVHHIAFDAWSHDVLWRELSALYPAFLAGRPSPLPELPVQYADYAVWQAGRAFAAAMAPQLAYWKERLAHAPEVLDLPADRPRPAVRSFEGGTLETALGAEETREVRGLARRRGGTPFMILLAAFGALLHRYLGQDAGQGAGQGEVVVGSPIAGRHVAGTEGLIGFFVNTLALRVDLGGEPTFGALAERVGGVTLEAYAHQDLPFERLVEELRPDRSLSHSPLFQVALAFRTAALAVPHLPGLAAAPLGIATRTAKFDLALSVSDWRETLDLALEYAADRFERSTAERLVEHFRTLLLAGVREPERRISELPLLTPAERHELLVAWNDTGRDFAPREVGGRGGLVHEQVGRQARLRPAALAVAAGGRWPRSLTYGELEARSNRLAHHLRRLGVGPESRVTVFMERTPERVIGTLAVLKAGGAYASVDPAHPRERLVFQIADAGSPVVLTQESLAGRLPDALPGTVAAVLRLDGDWEGIAGREDAPPAGGAGPQNLAYVIYTSGSTGTPKGVEISHAGLSNLVSWHREMYGIGPADRATQLVNPAFDASVWEVWPYLTEGAAVHIPEEEVRLSAGALARWWADEGITFSFLPTPLGEAVLEHLEAEGELLPRLSLRALLVGGDRLHRRSIPGAGFRLMNHYGPSESSVVSTVEEVPAEGETAREEGMPAIGRPIANLRAYVLDRGGEPLPVGVPGELCVAGVGLARGYLARPDLTAEKLVPDPFAGSFPGGPGERMYRTGDLVRWRPSPEGEASLDFLGRLDHQVKVRGLRIELGEIEAVLGRSPAVREAAVLLREGRLVAYLSLAAAGEEDEASGLEGLRGFLAERLPEYMVPTELAILPALPLSANGKIDRRALAALPPPDSAAVRAESVAPRTPLEESLAAIWAELFGLARVGVHDDFFDLGGHSLLATRVLSRVRRAFGLELPHRVLFEGPTVAGLARAVLAAGGGQIPEAAETGSRSRPAASPEAAHPPLFGPLSFAQRRLWFLDRLTPGSYAYNIPLRWRLEGRLDPAALAASLTGIVRRHSVLRTTYAAEEIEPGQVVHPAAPVPLPVVDLSGLPAERRQAESRRRLSAEAVQPFDLEAGPVLRARLLRLGERDHLFAFTVHHIAFDGGSTEIFLRELASLSAPEPPPWQYTDFAVWQKGRLAGGILEEQLGFWRRALEGAPDVLELPADHPRPPAQSFRGATLTAALPEAVATALRGLGRRRGATLFMTLLTAFQALLQRATGRDDLLVGSPIEGRDRPEVEGLIGLFVNTLALRADLSGDPGFGELLLRTRATCLAAFAHKELPFELLVEDLRPERDLSRSPLVQVLLAVEGGAQPVASPTGPRLLPLEPELPAAKLDLSLYAREEPGSRLSLTFEYVEDLFERPTIGRMAGHLGNLLAAAVADPRRRLSDLPLLSPPERAQILVEWNDTGDTADTALRLHQLFEAQAARTPGATALIGPDGGRLTYRELDARAESLAGHLRSLGAGPEILVGVLLERSAELIVALLAVLKSGGAYVPIDPAYPAPRVAFLLENSAAAVLVTRRALLERFAESLPMTAVPLFLDEDRGWESAGRGDGGDGGEVPGDLAYIIYTSGSTGVPKGVALEHRSAVALVRWALAVFPAEDLAAVFAGTSVCFDLSIFEIFVPLACGGTVVLGENSLALPSHPAASGVTLINTVPSVIAELVRSGGVPAAVRTVNLAGEVLKGPLVQSIYESTEAALVYNLYGPSEDTTYSTFALIPRDPLRLAAPSIGRPITGSRAYVLDRGLAPVPIGAPGEVYLAGEGLARGYLGRPDLTAERFVPDPFGPDPLGAPGGRLYRTGDLARWRIDGELELLGRIDHQVKVRGFRVELGEIEAALARQPSVRESAVLPVFDRSAGAGLVSHLAAFVVPADPLVREKSLAAALRAALRKTLPEPLVPTRFVVLSRLPLTPNGKLDRRALETAVSQDETAGAAGERDAPRTPLEAELARIWAQVLGVPAVGVQEDFFHLGGHSLLAMRAVLEIRRSFGVELSVRSLFEAPTVARLAERIATMASSAGTPDAAAARQAGGLLPLSSSQQRLWFLDRLYPGSSNYIIPLRLRIEGRLRPAALAAALTEIVRRHEVLRTTYSMGPREAHQVVRAAEAVALPTVDLGGLPGELRRRVSRRLSGDSVLRPFHLETGPVLRASLLRLDAAEHLLLLDIHHIAFDGWSTEILLSELAALYGASSPLPDLPWQYADFAVQQRSRLRSADLEEQLAFWRRTLAGAPDFLDLPTDHPRPPAPSFRGAALTSLLPADLTAALRELRRERGTTLFMTLLAGFGVLLQRFTGQGDLLVGSPIAGRSWSESAGLIGLFVNTLVLRMDLSAGGSAPPDAPPLTFGGLLERTRETCLAAYAHQDVPFETLVEELRPGRDLSRPPLAQVLLSIDGRREVPQPPGLRLVSVDPEIATARFDLELTVREVQDRLETIFIYSTDLFTAPAVQRLAAHLENLLRGAVADAGRPLPELPLLGAGERHQLLVEWSGAGPRGEPRGVVSVMERFAAQALETPEAPALEADEILTYAELDRRADRLARRLRRLGVGPGAVVGLLAERRAEMVAALLAVWKAGGACLPLDPAYPPERLACLLEDSQASLVAVGAGLGAALPSTVQTVPLDAAEIPDDSGGLDSLPDLDGCEGRHLAYLIYTPGTTGLPEAVQVEHRQLAATLAAVQEAFAFGPGDRMTCIASFTCDIFFFELLGMLLAGGTCVLLPSGPSFSRERLVDALGDATRFHAASALMREVVDLARLRGAAAPRLRSLFTGGDAVPADLLADLRALFPHAEVWELYGPTETTIVCTSWRVPAEGPVRPLLGRPLPGVEVLVCDAAGRPQPIGVVGEIRIGGAGVTRGYWRREELTAEKFVEVDGRRYFRSGDLARLLPDGTLELLDRRALAPPAPAEERRGETAPRTEVEVALARIWEEVLGVSRVESADDFFTLGGHSLLGMRVVLEIRRVFGVDLPVRALFEAPTLARLAERVSLGAPAAVSGNTSARIYDSGGPPLSYAQRRLWFLDRLAPGSAAYNIPFPLRLEGALAPAVLGGALAEIVRRHAVLRTTYAAGGEDACQVIHPTGSIFLPLVDLGGLGEGIGRREMRRLAGEDAGRPFDLEAGPVLRAALLRLSAGEHTLLLNIHHIAFDGWSMDILLRELAVLYGAFAAGRPSPLPELPWQYTDFSVWQRSWLAGETLEEQIGFWCRALAGAPDVLELPADHPRPPAQSFRGATLTSVLPADLADALRSLAQERRATLFMTLLAGFQTLLQRCTGEDDLLVGSPIAGRNRNEVEDLIGFFVNTLVLRANVSDPGGGGLRLTELLARTREVTLAAYEHQDLPFEILVEKLRPVRSLAYSPLFQVLFALQNAPAQALELPGLKVSFLPNDSHVAKFDLSMIVSDRGDTLEVVLEYATDLFERSTVERLGEHFRTLLLAGVREPERRISELPLLTSAERHELLVAWNDTERDFACPAAGSLVHEQLTGQARLRPAAVAVAAGGRWLRYLSYGELEARSNRLAHHLRRLGVGPESRVAVFMERTPERVVGTAAVLKAGGAYVSLDPAHPRERLAFQIADAGSPVVLTEESLAGRLPGTLPESVAAVLCLDGDWQGIAGREDAPPPSGVGAQNLAYVIYTSGSTGRPKGVEISHAGLSNLVSWHREMYGIEPADRATQLVNPAFDASVWEVWPYLTEGAAVHIPAEEVRLSAGDLARWWADEGITFSFLPTPLGEAVLEHLEAEGELLPRLSLRALLVGGDRLHRGSIPGAGFRLMNHYGPSESSVISTVEPVEGQEMEIGMPGIGGPIANLRVYVLDRGGEPVPVGVPGELCVAGVGLARGYLGRPDLTAERFVPNPFAGSERMYRTGDLVRWKSRPDGSPALSFVGRLDHQVKMRGLRIELGEIEAALDRHPRVRETAVLLREGRMVAYLAVVGAETVDSEELLGFMAERLPEYMVPAAFVVLPSLPLSTNGKIDRRALAALPPPESAVGREETAAPRTAQEEVLAGLFASVLRVKAVGIDQSFFDLGGHSLLAARLISRIREAFGVELPLRALFEARTVAGLAQRISGALEGEGRAAGISRAPRTGPPPLSFAQGRLWFLDQLSPGSAVYNIPFPLRLAGDLDPSRLARALSAVVRRHEALRTTFAEVAGEPHQVIAPPRPQPLPLVDLTGLDLIGPERRDAEARRLLAEDARRPFDLTAGPLLRSALVRLAREEQWLLLNVHHIVSDGWSMEILWRELAAFYGADPEIIPGTPPPLPELPVQYADFAVWQRQWLTGAVLDNQIAYWRAQLAGAPSSLELPTDHPRPAAQTYRGAVLSRALPPAVAAGVQAFSRRERATLFMTALAALDALLLRYSRQEDLAVGTVVAGRNQAEIEGLIGFFVNTLVLRTDLAGDPSFRGLLDRVRETALASYSHQDVPFETLVEELRPERDLSRSPFFQVLLAVQNPAPRIELVPGFAAEPLPVATDTAKFDLSFAVIDTGETLEVGVEYATDLFEPPTMERLLGHYSRLLAAIAEGSEGSERSLSDLPLLSPAEEAQILVDWNDTAASAPAPPACLHHLFEGQAGRTPGSVALIGPDGGRLTYRELDGRATSLAGRLRALGVGPEVLAGVMLDRSADLIVALLAVLKAGGAYVPIDPAYPRQRVAFLLENSAAAVLLTRRALLADFAESLPPTATPLFLEEETAAPVQSAPIGDGVDANLAYIIYTSGSTGVPKGVALEHRSAVAMVRWAQTVFPAEDLAGVLAATSVCFDLSVFEIFVPLAAGGTVVLAENALALPSHPAAGEVTLVNTVPSAMAELVRSGGVPAAVRTVNLAGEALKGSLVHALYASTAARAVYNLYGPSEDTTYSTFALIPPDAETPSIGRPITGTRAYVLDAALRPVPVGVPGAVYLAGDGLARGYLGRPELTAERFIPDPYGGSQGSDGSDGSRLYRTGDLARFRADGEMEFLGRIDHQVKVRGFRIELGEIEAALARLETVRESAVLALSEPGGEGRRLVAFVVLEGGARAEAAELRAALKGSLPEYMVPMSYVSLPALPLTPNGKLDRRALESAAGAAADETGADRASAEGGAPRTPVEEVLAGIWADVFGRRVGVQESFFDLGGHSLLAVRVVSRIRGALHVDLPLNRLFSAPTVADLAVLVEEQIAASRGVALPPIVPVHFEEREGDLPLSFSQQRLWLLDQIEPGTPVFNLASPLRLTGPLDPPALARALTEIARRHESLRTVFGARDGQAIQIVLPAAPLPLPVADLAGLPAERREEEARKLADNEGRLSFDLARGPLLRTALLRLAPEEHVLLATLHHIVTDGWSTSVLIRELGVLYEAFAAGRPSPLPDLGLQYPDFAVWQRHALDGGALAALLDRFKERFGTDLPVLRLPTDKPRPPVRTSRGGSRITVLPKELLEDARRFSQRSGATLFMTLLAAFQGLLARYTGQEKIVVGTPVAGRNRSELEGLIGFFVNTVVLPADTAGDPTFAELLGRVRDMALAAYACQDLPFEKLVEALQPERDRSRSPLFQVMFSLQTDAGVAPAGAGALAIDSFPIGTATAQFDLTLYTADTPDGLWVAVEYSTDLFEAPTIEKIMAHYQALLTAALAAPETRLSALPPADEELLRQAVEPASALAEPTAPPSEARRDRLADRLSRLTPAQREALERRRRGGGMS